MLGIWKVVIFKLFIVTAIKMTQNRMCRKYLLAITFVYRCINNNRYEYDVSIQLHTVRNNLFGIYSLQKYSIRIMQIM